MEQSEESIFHEALALDTAEARDEFLTGACAGQPELLQSVRSLLDAYSRNAFLDDTMLPEEFARSIASANAKRMDATVGPYHILKQIGHGGMGSVYMAEQRHPVRRMVAIKVIRQGLDSRDAVRRFHQEQRTLAMMDHPNIARVLDASVTESGVSYFVMELVNGIPILAFCDEHPLDVEQRLRLFIDCCQAIQHAHQKGIIHRDIKPSNVMVTVQDGQPVVKVIDFGIAKAFATDNPGPPRSGNTFATQLGEFLGTPQYMSPEQAALDGVPLDTRTDIYSLGALLYAILTGGPPFDSTRLRQATFDEIRQIVREEDPLRPSVQVRVRAAAQDTAGNSGLSSTLRRLSQRLSGDLDCIVMKALEKDRERRYSTVNDVAEDIRSFLDNKPIHARAPTAIYTLRKLTQRHRSLVLGTVSAVLCLLVGATAALVQANRATVQANRASKAEAVANRERDAAVDARKIMAETLYASDLRLASAATIARDAVTANAALQRHVPKAGETDPRSFDWHFLAAQNRIETRELLKSNKALYAMCRISGGTQIACCGMDGTIWIFDELTGKLLHTIQADQGEVNGLASSPNGTILASAGDDGTIAFWDVATGAAKGRFQAHIRQAFQLAYSVDGHRMATCGNEPGVKIWTVSDHALLCEIPSGGRALECLAVSVHDDLAFGAEGGIVTLTKMPIIAGESLKLRTLSGLSFAHCSAVAFSSDGRFLTSGNIDGHVIVRSVDSGPTPLLREFRLLDSISALTFSADGKSIAVGTRDGAVSLLDVTGLEDKGYRLMILDEVTDFAGNFLDGDANGTAGGHWPVGSESTSRFAVPLPLVDDNDERDDPVATAKARPDDRAEKVERDVDPPRLIRIDPVPVNGFLPRATKVVTLEFSEPVANANDLTNFEFRCDEDSAVVHHHGVVLPDSASAQGPLVTLVLPDSETRSTLESSGTTAKDHIESRPQHEGSAACVLFSQDGKGVLSVGADGHCVLVSDQRLGTITLVSNHIADLTFDCRNRLLVWQSMNSTAFFALQEHYEGASTDKASRLEVNMSAPKIASTTGTVFASIASPIPDGFHHSELRRWSYDLQESEVIWRAAEDERAWVHAVSPDEQFLAVETVEFYNGQYVERFAITIWNLKRQEEVSRGACDRVYNILFSSDSRTAAYSTSDGVMLFEPLSGRTLRFLPVAAITEFDISPDGQELATVSDDRMLRIWRIEDGSELHCIQAHGVSAKDVAYTPDGRTLGTVGKDGLFRCWRRELMQMTMEVPFSSPLHLLEFSPDGTKAAIVDALGRAFLLTAAESATEADLAEN